ncbi:hypothetical protein IMSAGC007_02266 [Lachnospiraceae bacterium]|nr:hypothetical protein IMSAGC007_02266 [Lachnospiraceae bacterium]
MPRIRRRQPQSRQSVRHDIRSSSQVLPGSRRKVHDPLNAVQHVPGLPPGHGHVVHSLRRLGSGELGLAPHLPRLVPQGIQLLPRSPGHRRHLAHGRIKISRYLHRRRGKPAHSRRDRHQLLPGPLNGRTHALQLLPSSPDLLQGHRRLPRLPLQIPQGLLRLNDFPLQGIILAPGNLPLRQRLIGLLPRQLQSVQFLLRLTDRLGQKPLLLRHQLRIAGVQLQQLVHVL